MAILIIEDEKKLVEILKKALRSEKYAFDVAYNGEEGLEKALKGNYRLIILDLTLPKKDGMDVCRELRARMIHTPIIMLTARGVIENRVEGLDAGADDYLLKPFSLDELFARIRAVLRRRKIAEVPLLSVSDIIIDGKKHEVTRAGKVILLTPKEYRILGSLIRSKGQAVTRQQLINEVWGPDFVETNNELNVHVRYLRRKVDAGRKEPLIQTIHRVGYAIKEN
ncbi:TPA: DNA-binding response regulator [Candidatus Nomurabacteria bacterium]|nr:DNA-binding response regulator [Candidatus Nomurabacteria bacterium]